MNSLPVSPFGLSETSNDYVPAKREEGSCLETFPLSVPICTNCQVKICILAVLYQLCQTASWVCVSVDTVCQSVGFITNVRMYRFSEVTRIIGLLGLLLLF